LNFRGAVDLSRSLENVQISRRSHKTATRKEARRSAVQGRSSTGCTYLLYTWKDKKCNEIVNIKDLMYSKVNDCYVKVDHVETGNGHQSLRLVFRWDNDMDAISPISTVLDFGKCWSWTDLSPNLFRFLIRSCGF
jgi:hypothetical protein